MRTCRIDFPGLDLQTSERLAMDVKIDEQAIIGQISEFRRQSSVSLEALGYILGSDPGQISRHLKGSCNTTLTNYIRIARLLGYRCKVSFEKADNAGVKFDPVEETKITSHKSNRCR